MPPCWGGTQVRIRLRDPRPQLREHRLQDPHSSHTPCTARKHVAGGWTAPWPRPLPIRPPIRSASSSATAPHWLCPGRLSPCWGCGRHRLLVPIHTGLHLWSPDREIRITQKGSQGSFSSVGTRKPRKDLKMHPTLPHLTPPDPRPRARIQHGRLGQETCPSQPQAHGHTNRHEPLHGH